MVTKTTDYDEAIYLAARDLAKLDSAAVLCAFLDAQPGWWARVKNGMAQRTAAPLTIGRVDGLTIHMGGGRREVSFRRDQSGALVGASVADAARA